MKPLALFISSLLLGLGLAGCGGGGGGEVTATVRTNGGVVTTLAGTAGSFGSTDGTGSAASFN